MAASFDEQRVTAKSEFEDNLDEALKESDTTYNNMISDSDKYYQDQIDASKDWAETQKKLQQENTDFAIEQINQQKDQAKKDYLKEQSGAYVDWQKQSDQYGANAEQIASMGLAGSGYSESSQVSMYNTYQNRVATARESYNRAVLNYDNAIKDAQLQNSSMLAEIAYQALQQQLELSLQGFQYKNTLILEKAKTKREIESEEYNKYLAVLDQINSEESLSLQERAVALDEAQFEYQKQQDAAQAARIKAATTQSQQNYNKLTNDEKKISANIKGGSSDLEIDMASVTALGYGPISAQRLDELVSTGAVIEYQEGNKIKFKRNTSVSSPMEALRNTAKKSANYTTYQNAKKAANKSKISDKEVSAILGDSFHW